eukprot:3184023-Amphidinium_carterae.2
MHREVLTIQAVKEPPAQVEIHMKINVDFYTYSKGWKVKRTRPGVAEATPASTKLAMASAKVATTRQGKSLIRGQALNDNQIDWVLGLASLDLGFDFHKPSGAN